MHCFDTISYSWSWCYDNHFKLGKRGGLCLFTVINLEYDPFSVAWELATAYTQFYNEQPPSVMSRLEMRYLIPISHLQKSNRKLKMFHRGQVETNNDK